MRAVGQEPDALLDEQRVVAEKHQALTLADPRDVASAIEASRNRPEARMQPSMAQRVDGKKVPVYGDGSQIREWIHVMDHCEGIDAALHKGVPGE